MKTAEATVDPHAPWRVAALLCLATVALIAAAALEGGRGGAPFAEGSGWSGNLASIFLAIVLEAAPYMAIGALVSALIEVFVPADTLPRLARRLGVLGIPAVALAAPLFPVCECGVVLVARRLLRKGLPLPHTIAYLLAAPILNPVVLGGTYIAYFQDPTFPFWRGVGGLLVAVAVGLLFVRTRAARALHPGLLLQTLAPAAGPDHHPHGGRLRHILEHVRRDFLEMGVYFLLGALIAATMKALIPGEAIARWGEQPLLGPLAMMAASFVMSLCSEVDAFVAAGFYQLDLVSHLAFLVLGPMLDIKLLLMYRGLFRARFTAHFAVAVVAAVSLFLTLVAWLPEGWVFFF